MENESLSSPVPPPPARLLGLVLGAFAAKSIALAAELGIAELLAAGPLSAEELAGRLGTDPGCLYRLLRALASVQVFQEDEQGRFSNTELSEVLRGDANGSLKSLAILLAGSPMWLAWDKIEYSIRTGRSSFEHVHGSRAFDYMTKDTAFARVFDDAMTLLSRQEVIAIHEQVDFSAFGKVLDIAGGHGALLLSCLEKNPHQSGILFDRPDVIERARALVQASPAAQRCELVSGDFFESIPAGPDAYLMKYILHDWSDQECVAILKNVRRAIRSSGRLFVIDQIVKAGNVPDPAKFVDLHMLVHYGGGRERTLAEFEKLLGEAGFRVARVVPTASMVSVIEAEPI
jgi:ubiquinone/menaquinone biosynthesis C-methylase UbiE